MPDTSDQDRVTPFLQAGERLVGAAAFELAPGIPRPPERLLTPRPQNALERRIAKPFAALAKVQAALNPLSTAAGAAQEAMEDAVPDSLWHGRGMGGDWGSAAGRFVVRMHDRGALGRGVLAVTDRRVLAVVDLSPVWNVLGREDAVHWQEPRAAVTDARRNAKGVTQRGRVDLFFHDGSWTGVVTDFATKADPLAAAFRS
ncbi:hypothetical protein [Kitasatospora camelliae]|uniref:Uncharacterized protein n=1 Tax=Kitasatospora camelliae TaxID=3156397 RepID=A0AAU8JTB0_9ACTN